MARARKRAAWPPSTLQGRQDEHNEQTTRCLELCRQHVDRVKGTCSASFNGFDEDATQTTPEQFHFAWCLRLSSSATSTLDSTRPATQTAGSCQPRVVLSNLDLAVPSQTRMAWHRHVHGALLGITHRHWPCPRRQRHTDQITSAGLSSANQVVEVCACWGCAIPFGCGTRDSRDCFRVARHGPNRHATLYFYF